MHRTQQQPKIKAIEWLELIYFKGQDHTTEELLKQQPMGTGSYGFISALGRILMRVPLFVKKDEHGSSTADNQFKTKLWDGSVLLVT